MDSNKKAVQRSKRGLSERTKLLNELFDADKATKIYQELEKKALEGEMDAIKLLLAYWFGRPKESMEISTPEEGGNKWVVEVLTTNAQPHEPRPMNQTYQTKDVSHK
jgi:hypothetical protein